jgi:hypothetical protein
MIFLLDSFWARTREQVWSAAAMATTRGQNRYRLRSTIII